MGVPIIRLAMVLQSLKSRTGAARVLAQMRQNSPNLSVSLRHEDSSLQPCLSRVLVWWTTLLSPMGFLIDFWSDTSHGWELVSTSSFRVRSWLLAKLRCPLCPQPLGSDILLRFGHALSYSQCFPRVLKLSAPAPNWHQVNSFFLHRKRAVHLA